ncbi:MAG: hypothetical protein SFW09_21570 [Hyphomicrobiaceae bacterium]|nr:hypothetical protein [Hyphomicrobiaceae bacterium]
MALAAWASGAAAADLISSHSDWKAYRHGEGRDRICFAVSAAKERQPSDPDRDMPHLYVTTWPGQAVKSEISIVLGFTPKRGTEISVDVGGTSFTLVTDADRGFVGDPADEERLLEAMRRGVRMTVEATAGDGMRSKDVFSLSGVSASVAAIGASCS